MSPPAVALKGLSSVSLTTTLFWASRFKSSVVEKSLSTRVRLLLADRVAVCAVTSLAATSPDSKLMAESCNVTVPSPLSLYSVA